MPKKKKDELENVDTNLEQQPESGETTDETMTPGEPEPETENKASEPDTEESPVVSDDNDNASENDGGDSGEEFDPALDPSLVIPTMPIPQIPSFEDGATDEPDEPPTESEESSAETENPKKPVRKRRQYRGHLGDETSEPGGAVKQIAGAAKRLFSDASKRLEKVPPDTDAKASTSKKERPAASKRVVAIDTDVRLQTEDEKEAFLWMELQNSLRSKRILTAILDGVERSPNGNCTAVLYYKGQRIVIPASEMFIDIDPGEEIVRDQKMLYNRQAQILSRSLGAQIDFIVSGIDRKSSSVGASRREAMLKKQQNFYLPTIRSSTPLINEGQLVEARIISVGDKNMRIEAFGVEASITAREVAWEWVDDCGDYYQIGDRVLVKILRIDTQDRQNIKIQASVRDAISNPARENIKKCNVQGKYIGKVTGVSKKAIYVRLNVGVNAIAFGVQDRKVPCRKDDVSFVITRIDEESGIAIGLISKVIKHFV